MNIKYSSSLCSDAIKLLFIKSILRNTGEKIKLLIESKELNGKDFESFMDLITKQATIDIFLKYFKYLKLFMKLNGYKLKPSEINNTFVRIFLSAYTLKYYPDIMNIDSENEVSKLLLNRSLSIIVSMKIINSIKIDRNFRFSSLKCIVKFFEKNQEFKKIFNEWKKLDMEAVICNLAKVYIDLEREFKEIEETSKDEELLAITKESLEKEKEKILEKVKKINHRHGIEIFNKYYIFLNQEIDLNIYKERVSNAIEENFKKAYWDVIKSDMLKLPPDYTKVIELLEESKFLLKQCTPRRQDLINEIDMHIEIDTLKHYIENEVDVKDYINNMMSFIIRKIEEYQSQQEKEDFDKFKENFNKLSLQESTKLSEILIYFFQGIMPRLNYIVESKKNFEEWFAKNNKN